MNILIICADDRSNNSIALNCIKHFFKIKKDKIILCILDYNKEIIKFANKLKIELIKKVNKRKIFIKNFFLILDDKKNKKEKSFVLNCLAQNFSFLKQQVKLYGKIYNCKLVLIPSTKKKW